MKTCKRRYKCSKCGSIFFCKNINHMYEKCKCGELARFIDGIFEQTAVHIPYGFKSVKPYVPEMMNPEAEVRHVCGKENWNPNEIW